MWWRAVAALGFKQDLSVGVGFQWGWRRGLGRSVALTLKNLDKEGKGWRQGDQGRSHWSRAVQASYDGGLEWGCGSG